MSIEGGSLGLRAVASQSLVSVSGGVVSGSSFIAGGGEVDVKGGKVHTLNVLSGGKASISGGTVGEHRFGSLTIEDGGHVEVSGGSIYSRATIETGGTLKIRGGNLRQGLSAHAGSQVFLVGSDYLLDGEPILGLSPGKTLEIKGPVRKIVSAISIR